MTPDCDRRHGRRGVVLCTRRLHADRTDTGGSGRLTFRRNGRQAGSFWASATHSRAASCCVVGVAVEDGSLIAVSTCRERVAAFEHAGDFEWTPPSQHERVRSASVTPPRSTVPSNPVHNRVPMSPDGYWISPVLDVDSNHDVATGIVVRPDTGAFSPDDQHADSAPSSSWFPTSSPTSSGITRTRSRTGIHETDVHVAEPA